MGFLISCTFCGDLMPLLQIIFYECRFFAHGAIRMGNSCPSLLIGGSA